MTIDPKKLYKTNVYSGNAKIYVGNKLVGTINNIDWGDAVFNGGCNCGSTAAKFKPGHKPGCAWWIFSDQYNKQYNEEREKMNSFIMGRFAPEEIVHCPRTLSNRSNVGMCGEDMGDNLGYGEGKPVNCEKCNTALGSEGYELHRY